MASWTKVADNRWADDDDPTHLLLRSVQREDRGPAEARYVELHDNTVHTYVGPPELADEAAPFGIPGDKGSKQLTWKATQTPAPPHDDPWAMLADIAR